MTNAADELHTLYSSWRESATAGGHSMKRLLQPEHAGGIAEIRRAYELLSVISEQLRYLEARGHRVSVYRRQLDGWARVPLSLSAGWTSNVQPDHVVTSDRLDQIEGLSAFLDRKVLDFDDSRIAGLRPLIDRADQLITGDEEMDPAVASYVRRLVAEIRYALDDEAAGKVFNYTAAVERLWLAFNAAAEKAPEKKKSAWRNLASQIFVGVTTDGVVDGGKALLAITTGIAL
jgi:hypothetical protein